MPERAQAAARRSLELGSARPIGELGLTGRTANALLRHGVNTVGQLIARSRHELAFEIRGLGEGGLAEIEKALKDRGLGLAAGTAYRYARPAYRSAINHEQWMRPVND